MNYQLLMPEVEKKKEFSAIEWVFANRGMASDEIEHYLHTTRLDILDPIHLNNIDEGAKMFISHLAKGDKIFIQVDSDVDGYTSAAALINYANMIAPGHAQQNISYRIHNGKEHGLIVETIPDDVKLVIAPDSSSNDYEQHKELKEKGINVLVLDHHEADKVSPDACVINNQLSKRYSNKDLSGVGVVYKFCQYIDQICNLNYADNLFDLVAIGMVADMMDLRNFETRELISLGIDQIRNPFIEAFTKVQSYSLKGELTPFGISFYIAPYINATIRVGSLEEKMLLFESMLEFRAYEEIPSTKRGASKGQKEVRVDQACRVCKNVKNRQDRTRDASLNTINALIERDNLLDFPVIMIQLKDPVEENLTGLIANQIMGKYGKPVLILNYHIEIDKETGEVLSQSWRGSGRNAAYSKLENFREFLANSGLVEYAQGHASAFGVGVLNENIDKLKEYIQQKLKDFDFSNNYKVDFIWPANEAEKHKEDIMDIGKLKRFWGKGLEEPYVAIENIKVHKDNLVLMSPDKKPTLKIILPGNLTLIKFGSSQEEFDNLYTEEGCITLTAIGTCNLNEWYGNFSPQIIIEEYQVIDKSAYYF